MNNSITTIHAILGLCIAATVALVSIRQWLVARDKLRLDLFDRRYKIFEATVAFLADMVRQGKVMNEAQTKFWKDTSGADFLFGPEIQRYLDEIGNHAVELRTHRALMKGTHEPEARKKLARGISEEGKWMIAQFPIVRKKFRPYLSLSHRENDLEAYLRLDSFHEPRV